MLESIPLYFLDAIRDGEREIRAIGNSRLSQLLKDVDLSDVQHNVIENIKLANAALSEGVEIRKLSDGLTEQLTPLVFGRQANLNIVVSDEDVSLLARNFRLRIRKNPNDPHKDISKQGTGLQNLTLISIFRYQIQKRQNDLRKKTPILTIEEPEAHLHPHIQQRLYKDLSQTDVPVIITTHSPTLVKSSDPASLVIFRQKTHDNVYSYQLSVCVK